MSYFKLIFLLTTKKSPINHLRKQPQLKTKERKSNNPTDVEKVQEDNKTADIANEEHKVPNGEPPTNKAEDLKWDKIADEVIRQSKKKK